MSQSGVAPAGSTLVVEIDSPDMSGTGRLFIGSNSAGQTAPSYLASESCGLLEPTDTAELGFPDMHIVMSVTGTPGGGDARPVAAVKSTQPAARAARAAAARRVQAAAAARATARAR